MKIDEYAPEMRPMRRARPNSSSVVAPSNNDPITSSDRIGMTAAIDVLIERISVWFSEVLTMSLYETPFVADTVRVFSLTLSNTTMPS